MGEDYKFISKFVEGKTLKELTEEEIEKLKSGVGVKKEDKEYIESLEKNNVELKENEDKDEKESTAETVKEETKNDNEKVEVTQNLNEISDTNKDITKSKNGVKVIQAKGTILKLEDNRTVILTKKELNEKPFWRKGDVYYG